MHAELTTHFSCSPLLPCQSHLNHLTSGIQDAHSTTHVIYWCLPDGLTASTSTSHSFSQPSGTSDSDSKHLDPQSTIILACIFIHNAKLAEWIHPSPRSGTSTPLPLHSGTVWSSYQCWSDGSFSPPDKGGTAFILLSQGKLIRYGLTHHQVFSPFQMETLVLMMAIKVATELRLTDCNFYTDSSLFAHSFQLPASSCKSSIWWLTTQFSDVFLSDEKKIRRPTN